MNKTYKENLNMWALDTDADHILHRVGSDDYTPIRHTTAKDPDAWEEIAVADIPPYNEAEYKGEASERVCGLSGLPRGLQSPREGDTV